MPKFGNGGRGGEPDLIPGERAEKGLRLVFCYRPAVPELMVIGGAEGEGSP